MNKKEGPDKSTINKNQGSFEPLESELDILNRLSSLLWVKGQNKYDHSIKIGELSDDFVNIDLNLIECLNNFCSTISNVQISAVFLPTVDKYNTYSIDSHTYYLHELLQEFSNNENESSSKFSIMNKAAQNNLLLKLNFHGDEYLAQVRDLDSQQSTLLFDGTKARGLLTGDWPFEKKIEMYKLAVFIYMGKPDMPIAFLYQKFTDDGLHQESLALKFLYHISTIYIGQWNIVYTTYQKHLFFYANRYLAHELAQLTVGLQSSAVSYNYTIDRLHQSLEKNNPEDMIQELCYVSEKANKIAEDIDRYAALLRNVINNYQINPTESSIRKTRFNLYSQVLNRLFFVCREQAHFKEQRIIGGGDLFKEGDTSILFADIVLIEQAIYNLITNALKYSYANTNIYITANTKPDKKNNEISVTSYGYPIEANEGKRIYEMGFRGNYARNSGIAGIGIGMYLVKKIAEAHSGSILYSSELLSDYCIPLIITYAKHKDKLEDINDNKVFLSEFNRLELGEITNEVISSVPTLKSFSPLYFTRRIGDPTARNRFTLILQQGGKDSEYFTD